MPGNEIEERIRILYELDNFSLGQHQSQAVDDNQPVLIQDQWVEKQREVGRPLGFNLKNYSGQQLVLADSLGGHVIESFGSSDQNYGQLTPKSDLSSIRSHSIINQELSANGFMLGQQNFQARQNQLEFLDEKTGFIPHNLASLRGLSVLKSQQEYASGDSPTLTTNSERSEMTDASTEFNFVGGQQKLVRGQQTGIPQPTSMQQSGYNDVHLLQQHIMFKQLQELQKQQQLQQFGEARQQNSLNQLSSIPKQASGVQYPTLINGTPVNDTSQMFMNWVQRGGSPAQQGISNRDVFQQEQSQTLRSMPLIPQQFDASLYGTPVASARGTMSQYSHVQGVSHDSPNWLNKVSGQAQKPVIQSPAVGNPFLGDQCTLSPDQAHVSQGTFTAKQGIQGKNIFGQVPLQGLNSGTTLGNSLLGTSPQANASLQELNGKQEPTVWPVVLQQKAIQHGPSQDLVSLDPIEEKILYNTDDDVWNSSFGRRSDMVTGGFGDALEQTEYSNVFPSLQSGSWSALMQSAVAEASSSDTGLQEEWSGLTFQNTELSTDNQTSNVLETVKQPKGWPDNNLQSDSTLGSKTLLMPNDSSVSSTFPGFHPTGFQFMTKQGEDILQDDSHETIQRSPKGTSEWVDCNPQLTLPVEGGEQAQQLMHLDNTWAGQVNRLSENNAHRQRIASYDGVNELSSKTEGYSSEAVYKRRDSDGFPWKACGDGGLSSFSRSTGGLMQVQSGVDKRENTQLFNFAAVPAACMTKAHQETSQQLADSNQLDYMKQVKVSMNSKENDKTGVKLSQIGNISNVMQNSYRAPETCGQQQSCYPRDNSYDSYNAEGSKGHMQGHPGQFKDMGDITNNAIGLDQGHLPNLQVDSRDSEKSPRGDLDISTTFHRSVGSGGPNMNPQTSQDMLELLPKVDQSKLNTSMPHFGSTSFNPLSEVADAGSAQTPMSPAYNQSSGSQGFSLRLSPPSQQLANSSTLFSQGLPQIASSHNLRQGHFDLGEKNQAQLGPPFPSFPASNELFRRGSWDNKFNTSERTNISPSLHIHQSSVAAIPSNSPFTRNQLQIQMMSTGPVSGPSSQAAFHGITSGYPPFNFAPSRDTSQQMQTNPSGQQFLGLEAVTTSQPRAMSSMLQQGGFSVRPQNLWANAQPRLSGMKPYKVVSMDPPRNSMEATSLNLQELTDRDSLKPGHEPSELRACSITSQGSVLDGDQSKKEGLQNKIFPEMINASQTLVTNISDKSDLASGSLLAHPYQQNLERVHYSHNHSPTGSEKSHESFDHSTKPSYGSHQSYSLLHQVQAMKNVETDQSKGVLNLQQVTAIVGQQSANEQNLTSRNSKDDGLNSHLNTLSCVDTKMLSFQTEAREDPRVKVSSQPALEDIPSQAIQNDFTSQPSGSNVVSNQVENSLANVNMGSSLFKQYASLRNGQIPPMYGAKLAGTAGVQFSLVKPSQTFGMHSSVERLDVADGSHSGRVWPSTAAAFVGTERVSASYTLSSDVIDQSVAAVKAKKRKTMISERLPWHKEVTQGSKWFQNISVAEQDWAQASNRLIEKVEDEAEIIEDGPPILRKKRRLIFTTQLMQQLLCPAPAPVFAAHVALQYDSVVCFVARLSLGNVCSLTNGKRNDLCKQPVNSNMISEELIVPDTEGVDAQRFSKAVDDFTSRAKKLESDLLRLDKAASILDLRLEHQELEKVSVINRFAKFHIRMADVSGTTSSSGTAGPRVCPQRYITPHPMPNNVPEGVQCLSL